MKTNIAPDLLCSEAHQHGEWNRTAKIIERRFFRDRQIAAYWRPVDYAFNHIRRYLLDGWSLEHILDINGTSASIFVRIESGSIAKVPPGKIRVKMWDRPEEYFSIRDLAEKFYQMRKQKTLF